jgi:NDP-sugar pyrophosphorylase family protein
MPPTSTSVVITMAGFGTRFLEAGYEQPKYTIEARGLTLFEWALRGLAAFVEAGSPFLFVVRGEDATAGFIREGAARRGIDDVRLLELDAPTDGQATTARLAVDRLEPDAPMAIFNIDTGIEPGLIAPEQAAGDGWLPCFKAPGDHWSFARTGESGDVVEVREKERISDLCTIGLYWFSSSALYAGAYDEYYGRAGREERGERYVAPLYNQLIQDRRRVTVTEIPFESVTPLGTPDEVEAFLGR